MTDREPDFQSDGSRIEGDAAQPSKAGPKKISFDDFQIQKQAAQLQVDEEKRAWEERQKRLDDQKPGFLKFAVPRLRSIGEEMIGGKRKFKLFGSRQEEVSEEIEDQDVIHEPQVPYFAEHEKLVVRVSPRTSEPPQHFTEDREHYESATVIVQRDEVYSDEVEDYETEAVEQEYNEMPAAEFQEHTAEIEEEEDILEEAVDYGDEDAASEPEVTQVTFIADTYEAVAVPEPVRDSIMLDTVAEDAQIESSMRVYLDSLRAFDSYPRRANEPRDPRGDFVTLLSEQLEILREQVGATSSLFFWVNSKKQQLVLECAALDDRAHMYLSDERKFPIDLDAVSMVVSKRKPELHSIIPAQAEVDLIPYYSEPIGIASFAAMPVLFGEGLVAVLTVDSLDEERFSAETLRILTNHSKLISGLIRSYIEKYDLLASARTLEAARKLHQIVSPDGSFRAIRDQKRSPEWILRALTEAAGEIIDWEWLATASFDDVRRTWCITSLQSKHTRQYVLPQSSIALDESIVGKCLQSGRASRFESLNAQQIRYSLEEDRQSAVGHSFMVIPIRTTNKNYGALAIEHSERARFTEADAETIEHLTRSAAAALEITSLSEIVGERALTDLLTGALNKRGFLQRTNEELARAMEFDEPLTLAIFEIDGAAEFFSRFSQEDSDTIVLAVTRLLKYGGRAFDVISRVGDHSFAALLVKMSDEEGYLWSEKMRKMIVSEVIAIAKRSFSVTVSVGIAGARRDGTVEELIEGAELALERAKELGGNNVIVY
jgi:diguanylate cyclase (GGDEF)-like protein